jgi:hypothetical protein
MPLRPPGRLQAPDRGRARARPDGPARRGLQPLRSGRQLPARLRAGLLQPAPPNPLGCGNQLRRRGQPHGARLLHPQRLYWLEEFHLDGLRLDAVHAICDDSSPDIIEELAAAFGGPGRARHVHLVLENERNAGALPRPRRVRPPGAWHRTVERRHPPRFHVAGHGRNRRLLHRLRGRAGAPSRSLPERRLRLSGRSLDLRTRRTAR